MVQCIKLGGDMPRKKKEESIPIYKEGTCKQCRHFKENSPYITFCTYHKNNHKNIGLDISLSHPCFDKIKIS